MLDREQIEAWGAKSNHAVSLENDSTFKYRVEVKECKVDPVVFGADHAKGDYARVPLLDCVIWYFDEAVDVDKWMGLQEGEA